MPDLGSAKYTLYTDAAPFEAGLAEAEGAAKESTAKVGKAVNGVATKTTEAQLKQSKRMGEVSGKLAEKVALPILALGAVSVDLAVKQDEAIKMSEGVFGKQAKFIDNWASHQANSLGLSTSAALGLADKVGLLGKNAGLSGPKLKDYTVKLSTMAGQMSKAFHVSGDTVTAAMQAAASGRSMALKKYGILLDANAVKEYAVAHGIGTSGAYAKSKNLAMEKLNIAQKKYNDALKANGKNSEAAALAEQKITIDQTKYNEAVSKYGEHSLKAKAAAVTLKSAQDALAKSGVSGNEKVKGALVSLQTAQGNLNKVQKGGGLVLTAAQKAQATMGVVLQHQAAIAKLAAKQHESLGFKMQQLKANAANLMAELGKHLVPALTHVVKYLELGVAWLAKHKTAAKILGAVLGILAGIIVALWTAVKVHTFWLKVETMWNGKAKLAEEENTAAKTGGLKALIKGTGAMVKNVAVTGFNIAKTIVQTAMTWAAVAAQWAWNAAMDANPIMLVIIAIVAIIAIMVVLYKKVGFVHRFIDSAFHAIVKVAKFVWAEIKKYWYILAAILLLPISPILAVILVAYHFRDQIIGAVKSVISWVGSNVGAIWDTVSGVFNRIVSFVGNLGDRITSAASGIWDGLAGDFKDVVNSLIIDPINSMINEFVHLESEIPGSPNLHIPHDPIPRLAGGTTSWRGGAAIVGDQGPELVNLPRGSRVTGAPGTAAMRQNSGGVFKGKMRITNWADGMAEIEGMIQDGIDRNDDWHGRR